MNRDHIERTPLKRKWRKKKPGDDRKYLVWIRTLHCLLCGPDNPQTTRTEAAHLGLSISRRGLSQKYPDSQSGPLCARHHRTGRDSLHRLGKSFWGHHGVNRDLVILGLQMVYAAEATK